jgi:ribosomal-protein-alanine N-acetyltransferase
MAGDFPIRPATEADLQAIADIEHAVFSDPWPIGAFRKSLAGLLTVAVSGDRVVGYLAAHHAADMGEILNVAVHPEYRRLGIGEALVEDGLWRLAGAGIGLVFLEVRESNSAAQKLYEGMGFERVGKRRGYYRAPVEDAVVMRISNAKNQ